MSYIEFKKEDLEKHLSGLHGSSQPGWGKMTSHQMVEHLIYVIKLSLGEIKKEVIIPKEKVAQSQAFLESDQPMPRNFEAKFIKNDEKILKYEDLEKAKDALLEYCEKFHDHYNSSPDTYHTHPIFGELNYDGWQQLHQNHCTHHLQQFGLI